jgi:hypothetical protein
MNAASSLLQRLRERRPRRHALLCAFAMLLVLQTAVPLLAALAAHVRGVSVADVCPVHGVRVAQARHQGDTPADTTSTWASSGHCALNSIASAGLLPVLADAAALVLQVSPRVFPRPPAAFAAPINRPLSWLAARTHGPPASA